MAKRVIYLDYAAATPVDSEVAKAMQPYHNELFFNPSALYTAARQIRREMNGFRSRVASVLGVKPGEIHFTAGATESINLAFAGLLRRYPGSNVAISVIEHSAVTAAAKGYAEDVITLPVESNGRVKVGELESLIDDKTVLISVAYVDGEIGTVQPLSEVVEAVSAIRKDRAGRGLDLPLYIHSDASQAPEFIDISLARTGIDLLTLNGGKIYGPKQSGILYVRQGVELEPLIYGGGQEGGIRAGTENVAAQAGFAKALEIAQAGQREHTRHLSRLQQKAITGLEDLGASLNGGRKHRIAGNINVSFAGINGETLVHYLDAAGVMVATGAACQAGSDTPNPVLVAIGCTPESVTGSLRISMGRDTGEDDIEIFLAKLNEILSKLH